MASLLAVDPTVVTKAKNIKLLLLDVDGVLTDGKLYFTNDGSEIKAFNTLDGHGIKMLMQSGVEVGIITGRTSTLVQKRAGDLGIRYLFQGREDKYQVLDELRQLFPCALEDIAFMGDDFPDLAVMLKVGLALTVPNAARAVLDHAHWVSDKCGGEGAVREACELIMEVQGTYSAALNAYLNFSD